MLEHSGSKMARTIACFQWEGGYLAQLYARVALHVVAGHAVGATGVPGDLSPQGCLFRVHPHNHLLKNEVRFRAPQEYRVNPVILGQQWAELCRRRRSVPNLSAAVCFAEYHPDRRCFGN